MDEPRSPSRIFLWTSFLSCVFGGLNTIPKCRKSPLSAYRFFELFLTIPFKTFFYSGSVHFPCRGLWTPLPSSNRRERCPLFFRHFLSLPWSPRRPSETPPEWESSPFPPSVYFFHWLIFLSLFVRVLFPGPFRFPKLKFNAVHRPVLLLPCYSPPPAIFRTIGAAKVGMFPSWTYSRSPLEALP